MPNRRLHLVGNAHLDPVWLWPWQEGFQAIKATFRSALDRMAETPGFLFTSSSAAYYEWVEQNDPVMFAEIKQRVTEGRWRIVGGWWVQPDCNLPGGEAFVRQGLCGQRYFLDRFGHTATVGYNPDSFGHCAMLPQILRKSGLTAYVFMRPEPEELPLPGHLFQWEAPDGSRVAAFRIIGPYATLVDDIEYHIRQVASALSEDQPEAMCFFGVGNHGGGPTRAQLQSIQALQQSPGLPDLRFSSPPQFFATVAGEALPVYQGELQHHARGCYAAHSGVKAWNRQAEHLLLTAEKFCTVASVVTGQPYPAADLTRAWKELLFLQFHDILAGSSLKSCYDDARDGFGLVRTLAARALNQALQSIAWSIAIPTQEEMLPFVVFNPHAWPVTAPVEVELARWVPEGTLLDASGRPVPYQYIQPHGTAPGRRRICFLADLPPLGYQLYRFAREGEAGESQPHTGTALENTWLRLTLDPATGLIASLFDKRSGTELMAGPGARPAVVDDPSDTWGHFTDRFTDEIGSFQLTGMQQTEAGPVRSTLRATYAWGNSTLVQEFTLYAGLPNVYVTLTVAWHEQAKLLKLWFPTVLSNSRVTYEIPYGHLERPATGEEEPGQCWVDISGPGTGLAILNDAKYSYSASDGAVSLTVLRSPIYAHHVPMEPEEGATYEYMDQGAQTFRYVLLPHGGDWREAAVARRAEELNAPAVILPETFHDGPLPTVHSFLSVASGSVMVTALKRAEDGDAVILRCRETAGRDGAATIRVPWLDRTFSAAFGPCEIKTFKVPLDRRAPVTETNLLELPGAPR